MGRPGSSSTNTRADCSNHHGGGGSIEQYEATQHKAVEGNGTATTSTRVVVPETYEVLSFTATVKSDAVHAGPGDASASPLDLPSWEADAQILDEIEVNEWRFQNHGGVNFGAVVPNSPDDDLFGLGEYKIARIDRDDGTQTVWTAPEGWRLHDRHYAGSGFVDGSRVFFSQDKRMASFDPATGTFTSWPDVGYDMASQRYVPYDDAIYGGVRSELGYPYVANPLGNLTIEEISYHDPGYSVHVGGASGYVTTQLTTPSGHTVTGTGIARSDGSFTSYTTFVKDTSGLDVGTYEVRVKDWAQDAVLRFEVVSQGQTTYKITDYEQPNRSNVVFMQKFDPDDSTVTYYYTNASRVSFSISHVGPSGVFATEPTAAGDILRFVPNDDGGGTLTRWDLDGVLGNNFANGFAVHDEKIYFGNHVGRHTTNIIELDTSTGQVTEITLPYTCEYNIHPTIADSAGNIFFSGCDTRSFYKFVPSTDTFTKFSGAPHPYRIDSDDTMYYANGHKTGTLKLLPAVPVKASITTNFNHYPGHGTFASTDRSNELHYDVEYDRNVRGFDSNDILVSGLGGYVNSWGRSHGALYDFTVPITNNGTITVGVREGAATDRRGLTTESATHAADITTDRIRPSVLDVTLSSATGTMVTVRVSEQVMDHDLFEYDYGKGWKAWPGGVDLLNHTSPYPDHTYVSLEDEAGPDSATVQFGLGSSAPGCEETSECYIPHEVTISVGGEITWINGDGAAHTVTAGDPGADASAVGESYPNGFDSGLIMSGGQYRNEFDYPGTYPYFCVVHPWRTGIVTVHAEVIEASKVSISNDTITITLSEPIPAWAKSPALHVSNAIEDLAGHSLVDYLFDIAIN